MDRFDVVVVGAGLAGLAVAREMAERKLEVLLVDRKPDLARGVHTTGIFTRRTLESFALPADCLGPALSRVVLHSPKGRRIVLRSARMQFRLGRMGALYEELLGTALRAGVTWAPAHGFTGVEFLRSSMVVELRVEGQPRLVRARFLVGADGASSRVARHLHLDENHQLLLGAEEVFEGVEMGEVSTMHCFFDPRLAPGYIGWAVNDGQSLHVGVGGLRMAFNPQTSLARMKERAAEVLARDGLLADRNALLQLEPRERRSGLIPVGGVLRRIAHHRGLLVGDAAGAVSPLTAGGLDPCLRLAPLAATVAEACVRDAAEEALQQYSGDRFRRAFGARLLGRRVFYRLKRPQALEAGLGLLNLPPLGLLARHVFFGDGSFPECPSSPGRVMAYSQRLGSSRHSSFR